MSAFGLMNGINMQQKSIIEDFYPNRIREYSKEAPILRGDRQGLKVLTKEISEQSPQVKSQTTTSWSEDSHVRLSQLLESEEALPIQGELFSSKSPVYSKIKTQNISSLKMLKDCYLTTTEGLLKSSSQRLQNFGMTYNGKCLTARISESPRIGKECSLSDILEEQVDPKYFLSEKLIKGFLNKMGAFGQRFSIVEKEGISPTITSRYWKRSSTDPYINSTNQPTPTIESTEEKE